MEYCEESSLLSSPTKGQPPLLDPEEVSLPDVDPSELQRGDTRGDWSMLTCLFAVITFLWGESWGCVDCTDMEDEAPELPLLFCGSGRYRQEGERLLWPSWPAGGGACWPSRLLWWP